MVGATTRNRSAARHRQLAAELDLIDDGLTRLRRFWNRPEVHEWIGERIGDVPAGADASVFRVMRAIEQAQDGPASVGAVADALQVDASTASRLVERAVAAGTVERKVCAGDRRRSELALTAAGLSVLAELHTWRTRLLAELTREWDESDVSALGALMLRLDAALADLAGPRAQGENG